MSKFASATRSILRRSAARLSPSPPTAHLDRAVYKASSATCALLGSSLAGVAALGVWFFKGKKLDGCGVDVAEADFVIVGAGSSGCALAARLSQGLPNKKILLLEAGEDDDVPEIQTAVDYFGKVEKVFTSDRDWGHGTEPQKGLGGRGLYWPRGKVIGGCSSFNTMVWMRPDKTDLDNWGVAMHDMSWSYAGMLPFFKRAERHVLASTDPEVHGSDGPIAVARLDHPQHNKAAHEVTHTFVAAAQALGHRLNNDFGRSLDGVGINDVCAVGGKRCSAAAYLREVGAYPKSGSTGAKSGNLEVKLMTQVTKILFDESKQATGVEIVHAKDFDEQKRHTIHAREEIILCGGAVNSPHLLLLSGVGPRDQLEEFDIKPVANVQGVGKNLQDHLHVAMSYRLPNGLKPHPQSNICEGSLFAKTTPLAAANDLQVHIGTVFFEPDGFYPSGEGFTLTPTLINSKITGEVRLRSTDPFEKPIILPGYLEDMADKITLREGVKLCRKLGQDMLKRLGGGEEVYPGLNVSSDADIDDYIRKHANTVYHPACTCKAGTEGDPLAVLDAQFRVRGVKKLRVADASSMPLHVGCNTNATCVALGERAAATLLEEYSKPEGESTQEKGRA